MFALVITGPPGAGKTEVLVALSDLLVADDIRHASVEVEALTSAHPPLEDDRWAAPLQAVCSLYRHANYELLLVTATVESQRDLDAVLAAIGGDEHAVVRLEADPPTLRRRIVEREPDGWPGLDELLATADRITPAMDRLDGIALTLSTEGERPEAVAQCIRGAFPEALSQGSAALAFAQRLAEISSQVLGESLLSVILHGSLTLDDYVPGHSDIDLLAIVDHALSDSDIASLTRAVTAERARAPAPVDLRFVTRAVATAPPECPPLELYLRLTASAPPDVEARRREPDLIVELSICRQHGRALRGAAPRKLIGAVPPEWVLRVGDEQLARWQSLTDDAPYAALMVLTACRIWRFSEERIHCSKSAAGMWALTHDPSLQAIRGALRQRSGDPVPVEPAEIARLLEIVRARIATICRSR